MVDRGDWREVAERLILAEGRLAWSGGAIDFGGGAIGVKWRSDRYWRTEPTVEDGSSLKRVKRGS